MSSLWRRRRRGRGHGGAGKRDGQLGINSGKEFMVPAHFRCPISLDLMKDPVSLATGITYDRECIETWLDTGNATCPVTKHVLRSLDQIPNHALRKMIQCWCVENKSYGVERIPTPRVPITAYEVSEVCSRMAAATAALDGGKCGELVAKIKNWVKESERNKRCLVSNGIGAALAEMFERFSMEREKPMIHLLEEIISALPWSFPLSDDAVSKLKSPASLRCMAWLLKSEDLSTRQNAVLVMREMVVSDDQCSVEVEGIEESLIHMVKAPICPRATQACLLVIRHMIQRRPAISSTFAEMGLVGLALDILVEGNNKSMCEKALGVLDEMCDGEEGKRSACGNALTIPVVVKKILRVSNAATELCVSILWKVCVGGKGEGEEGWIRALQFGGFQKVLVALQVGCGKGTKEKGTELLRFMNVYRGKVHCFDSSLGFKYVQTSI